MSEMIEMVLVGNKHTMKDSDGVRQRYVRGDRVMLNRDQVKSFRNKFKLPKVLEAEEELDNLDEELDNLGEEEEEEE